MKRQWLSISLLLLLFVVALWGSSSIEGEAVAQMNETERWETPYALLHQAETRWAALRVLEIEAGRFRAYFLNVEDGVSAEMNILKENLSSRYRWSVADISLEAFVNGEVNFHNPATMGEVLVIAGGSTALSDAELDVLQDYVDNGGNLVIFAGTNLNERLTSLATSGILNQWLYRNWGLRFNSDVVLDKTQAFESPLNPASTDFDEHSFIATNGIFTEYKVAAFEAPNSITISETPPANVVIQEILRSTQFAYSKTDLRRVMNGVVNFNRELEDGMGPFVLAASAENLQTGSRIVLFGSTSLGVDRYETVGGLPIDNISVAFNSLVWTTHFYEYFDQMIDRRATATAQSLE